MTKLFAARGLAVTVAPYLATALHAMTVVATPAVPTMAVDRYWRCYAAPGFVAVTPVPELAAVWLHEVAHLVRDHHARALRLPDAHEPAEQLRLNLAMDCEINDDLLAGLPDGHPVRLPDGAVTPALLGLPREDLFEGYLARLPRTGVFGRLAWLDCGSGAHAGPVPWELGADGAHPLGPYEAAAVRFRVREAIKGRPGTVPAGWRRWAEDAGEPLQDWRTLLGAAVRAGLAAAGAADYSYRRPGRRSHLLDAALLPGLHRVQPAVAVVIDTSGSVSDGELGTALAEVEGITRAAASRVAVYSCDAAVHTAQRVFTAERVSLVGGGGTDLRRGLARAGAARPRPDVVVVLTDGFTPWPDRVPRARVVAGLFGPPPVDDERAWAARPPDWVRVVRLDRPAGS